MKKSKWIHVSFYTFRRKENGEVFRQKVITSVPEMPEEDIPTYLLLNGDYSCVKMLTINP